MRVSIDCRYVRGRPSGIGSYVQALVERVPSLAPDARFHLWVSPQARRPLSSRPNVTETVVGAPANGVRTLAAPARLVDLRGVDLLHAPFNTLGRALPCPAVVTVHDLMWLLRPDLCEGISPATPLKYLYYRDGIMRALRRAARIIAISRATADDIAKVAPEARARVRVIHHGVEARFQPSADADADQARVRRLGVPGPYFLAVGQNAPYKNHGAILAALAAARFAEPTYLVLLQRLYRGGGFLTLGMEDAGAIARRLAISARVVELPDVDGDDLLALLRGALALVQFSRCEGFGMPALEALASGTPVVASRVPALVEVLGDAAVTVPLETAALARALERVASDPVLRAELAARGLERARTFSWDKSAALHLEAYREAVG
jgi:glycosyltransferase involved in cell wall biosynthesis